MTVKELIEKLSAMPQDVEVTINTGWEGPEHMRIENVALERGPHDGPIRGEPLHGPHILITSY